MRGALKIGAVVWAMASAIAIGFNTRVGTTGGPADAPTGFDGASNGFAEEFCANQHSVTNSPNSPEIPADECTFDNAVAQFTETEGIEEGLGPVFNSTSCADCHAVPIVGGSSQINEKRAGYFDGFTFFEHPGGSLIHDRAIDPSIQELTIPAQTNVVTLRSSVSVLGDGFVEAVANQTLEAIAASQPPSMRGQFIYVVVSEKPPESDLHRRSLRASSEPTTRRRGGNPALVVYVDPVAHCGVNATPSCQIGNTSPLPIHRS